jgi:glutathione S-transferase
MSTSPAFILYGHPSSINTDRVRLTLAAANITNYEWVSLDMLVGEHKVGPPLPSQYVRC